jgi:pseudouridine-5'-phosphate glycosidase
MNTPNDYLEFHHAVRQAIEDGQPVLALESTAITHGLPFPQNLETAQQAEQAARDAGATPATIAVRNGKLKVGLSGRELERLARAGPDAVKCSRGDIPILLQSHGTAGTTVAATMTIAAMAGIRVFATGGIGGVHRGAERSMDISADLQELARTPVAVVCAGPKSILDIGLTLEYLETHGVPVIGYGTDEVPAFLARESGHAVDCRLDSPEAVAKTLAIKWSLGLGGAAVIANPIATEAAMERLKLEQLTERAIRDAEDRGVSGKRLTPFLLRRLNELTNGASLEANVRVLLDNARLGAEIAVALNAL